MVHRSADSRLLANLISHEKDYSKQLQDLLDTSHASFTSLTAYASSSPPPASQVILAVAGSLSSADDALRGYAAAVEEWSRHLKGLKDLEDEVGSIMRDREILVTRLLKASKSASKPSSNRDSAIFASSPSIPTGHPQPSRSTSTLSVRSSEDPSTLYAAITSSSPFTSPSTSPIPGNKKMQAAQSELQACEAHLALKEQELDNKRSGAIRDGLCIRFRALAECGMRWTEVGKEVEVVLGLRVGEGSLNRPSNQSSPFPPANKPLPEIHAPIPVHAGSPAAAFPDRPSSDLSSIAPSQSASQVNLSPPPSTQHIYTELEATSPPSSASTPHFHVPPAHAIAELGLPTSTPTSPRALSPVNQPSASTNLGPTSPTNSLPQRHILPHRITEEDLGFRVGSLSHPTPNGHLPGSPQEPDSSDNEDTAESEVRVVENPRFAKGGRPMETPQSSKGKHVNGSASGSGSGFLGSIRGLFLRNGRGSSDRGSLDDDDDSLQGETRAKRASKTRKGLGFGKNKAWDMRTEKNIKGLQRDGSDGEDGNTTGSPPAPFSVSIPSSSTTNFPASSLSAGAAPSISSQGSPRGRVFSDVGSSKRLRKGVGARGKTASSDLPDGVVKGRRRSASLDPNLKIHEGSSTPTPTSRRKPNVVDLSNRLSRAEEWVDHQTNSRQNSVQVDEKAWPSDTTAGSAGAAGVTKKASVKRKKSNRKSANVSASTSPLSSPSVVASTPTQTITDLLVLPSSAAGTNLSRDSSLRSAASSQPRTAARAASGRVTLTQSTPAESTLPTQAPTTTHNYASRKARAGSLDEGSKNLNKANEQTSVSLPSTSTSKAQRRVSSPVSIVPAGALSIGEGSVSLMSIVEDVAKANREGWGSHASGPGSVRSVGGSIKPAGLIEVVKAPHSFSKNELLNVDLDEVVGHGTAGSHSRSGSSSSAGPKGPVFEIPRAPGSVFDRETKGEKSSPANVPVVSAVIPAVNGVAVKPSRPAHSPLKSALRNPSRTPSPMLPLPPKAELLAPPTKQVPTTLQNGDAKGKAKAVAPTNRQEMDDGDDAASISSYETGHELFDEDEGDETEHPPPTPRPHDHAGPTHHAGPTPHAVDHHQDGSDVSASTTSTETHENVSVGSPPRKRKSVRVSLQPTFSTTPPAIEDDDDDPVLERGWKAVPTATAEDDHARDMWADSSDEDVEYQRARRLLNRFSKKEKSKKGAAHR